MIAPRPLPKEYTGWNRRFHAPGGRHARWAQALRRRPSLYARYSGPFSIQSNNSTREFEYPWAFHAAPITPGMRVLEVGGSLAGFQFVLSRLGCSVVNVDPGTEAEGVGWPCDRGCIEALNRLFGTSVELRNTTVPEAGLEAQSFDRAYCISVLEHLEPEELPQVMEGVYNCLKPGGRFILTADLFLDLYPFTTRQRNEWGRNLDVRALLAGSGFELEQGNPAELCGFPEFDPDRIQSQLGSYLYGTGYPTLVQCLVLRKAK